MKTTHVLYEIKLVDLQRGPTTVARLWAEVPDHQVQALADDLTRAMSSLPVYGEQASELAGCVARVGERRVMTSE